MHEEGDNRRWYFIVIGVTEKTGTRVELPTPVRGDFVENTGADLLIPVLQMLGWLVFVLIP